MSVYEVELDAERLFANPEAPIKSLLMVPRFSVLRFVVRAGSMILPFQPRFISNYPDSPTKQFEREIFYTYNGEIVSGVNDWVIELGQVDRAGSFTYYLEYSPSATLSMQSSFSSFNIEPILTLKSKELHLHGVVVQTVLTKLLGPIDRWIDVLSTSSKCGYNMIHFTPVQELGLSHSSYSIYNQMSVSSKIFEVMPNGAYTDFQAREKKLRETLEKLEKEYNLLSMSDVVWNHTAHNTPWLADHPEAGYTTINCPHLKVAFELDLALQQFSQHFLEGKLFKEPFKYDGNKIESSFEPKPKLKQHVNSEVEIHDILRVFRHQVWPTLKLWEYFVIHVDKSVGQFRDYLLNPQPSELPHFDIDKDLSQFTDAERIEFLRINGLYNDSTGERYSKHIHLHVALLLFNSPDISTLHFESDHLKIQEIERRCKRYRAALDAINMPFYAQYDKDFESISTNLVHRVRRGKISRTCPLIDPYFTRVKRVIKTENGEKEEIIPFANNGWIWNGNPEIDFAGEQSQSYFLREVIIWGDCVKLRYGHSPNDSPWLWEHMKQYTQWTASIFHGIRIDNCHSTPIHLAKYMLDAARQIRPELYVMAELFTGSDEMDSFFVSKLGINSLVREAMAAYDPWDLGRHVHRYGGKPVGSVKWHLSPEITKASFTSPGAILVDCTHDNETPAQKRTPQDALPNCGLVCMSSSAIGSSLGYDQLVPRNIDVVKEKRLYPVYSSDSWIGLMPIKQILNNLHVEMAQEGYSEIHVHQVDNVITVQRHSPATHRAVYMIAHTAFYSYVSSNATNSASLVRIPGQVDKMVVAATLRVDGNHTSNDSTFINGLNGWLTMSTDDGSQFYSSEIKWENGEPVTYIHLKNFPPGSILVLRASLFSEEQESMNNLKKLLNEPKELQEVITCLDAIDLNELLYRAEEEERATNTFGTYDVPKYGKLTYCGLAGVKFVLDEIRKTNDMGHPLFNNLREGNWLMDYHVIRLNNKFASLSGVQNYLRKGFDLMKKIPRFLIPKYFDLFITQVYDSAVKHSFSLMSKFVNNTRCDFLPGLALGSIQLVGVVPNSLLPDHSVNNDANSKQLASMAAGLPHFSSGYMRCWGRDTFIALRGLLLVTGRYKEAKQIILSFASTLRHGLIPNLLDGGNNPRYNARDATWWFLQGVQDYCKQYPEGAEELLLNSPVKRLFPTDDHDDFINKRYEPKKNSLVEIIYEIIQKHALGIHFREWNAGKAIDSKMKDEGFQVDITLDQETGFILGGSKWNCGTWMDKMGESERAQNIGIPATPRDGADIEIIGLLKSTLRWLINLHSKNIFPYEDVSLPDGKKLKIKEWDKKIQDSFELRFWVPIDEDKDSQYYVNPIWVNRRGIYRDTVGSTHGFTDFQLRPNQCVAMTVAPELFDPSNAAIALNVIESVLVGPMGMKTLDPTDWNYHPIYDMSNDTDDYHTAKGFNYHQGPEWVWCMGYFLRAKLHFHVEQESDSSLIRQSIYSILRAHRNHLKSSSWLGIPELTNADGKPCYFSCPTQAWSISCLLDTLYDLCHVASNNNTL